MANDCKALKAELYVNAVRTVQLTAQGREYCMSAEERVMSNNFIKGNCEIVGTILTTLFDSRSTYSFKYKDM